VKPKVYIETSIPSFYYEERPEPDMVARKLWTRQWWEQSGSYYSLVTSVAVLDELRQGTYPNKTAVLDLVNTLPLIPVTQEIVEIVQTYIQHHVMPQDPVGDALHLALASYHKLISSLPGTVGIWQMPISLDISAGLMRYWVYTYQL
jgi:hypothetical protein